MPAVMLLVFAVTLFISASLMFIIEFMVGKMMLPLMGGTPAVWNTCMVFYQAVLLAGYYFAHASIKWLGPRAQARLQIGIVTVPFLAFIVNLALASGFLAPNEGLIAGREGNPIPPLLLVLSMSIGVPMAVISTSAPVLSRWFSATDHPSARDPYFLYGASNLGSMLALISYPFLIEPNFSLQTQQIGWVVGYALLAGLAVWCAFLMWKSNPAVESAPAAAPAPTSEPVSNPSARANQPSSAIKSATKTVTKEKAKPAKPASMPSLADPLPQPSANKPVTWERRFRWIMLAAVPSSLMLGVTTYITTDIAALSMLWMPPLFLYLLTFIIVFAVISARTQSIVTFVGICLLSFVVAWKIAPMFFENPTIQFLFWVLAAGAVAVGLLLMKARDPHLIHRVMVIIMPLLLLLLLFMMLFSALTGVKPPGGMIGNILIHLVTLFVVAMVCHGEMAVDRPEPKHLTEFFLLMSFGGVVGGLFNGLLAPVIFTSIVEYELAMVVACLLLPPLGDGREGSWARYVDVALGGVILLIGLVLLVVRFADKVPEGVVLWAYLLAPLTLWAGFVGFRFFKDPQDSQRTALLSLVCLPLAISAGVVLLAVRSTYRWDSENQLFGGIDVSPFTTLGAWKWSLVAVLGAIAVVAPLIYRRWKQPIEPDGDIVRDYRLSAVLDLLMPLALLILVLGLFWGLPAPTIKGRLTNIAGWLQNKRIGVTEAHLIGVLTFGLPAVLCYTFVERWARFGLGVGALLLAGGISLAIREGALYQDRSYFGVLKVEDSRMFWPEGSQYPEYVYPVHRLVHGTTLHGKQFKQADIRDTPLSYYHRTGPVGQVFSQYNTDPKRAFAVIGLGTGTMASYGLPGQRVDFFDIDPIVVDISYDSNEYFHFVEDAQNRGVDIGLILGDARLTFDPRDWRERKKIASAPIGTAEAKITDDVTQKRQMPLRARWWHKAKPEKWLAKMDDDKDGQVSWEEFPGTRSEFDAIDTNSDGSISLNEARQVKLPTRQYGEQLTSAQKYRLIVVDAFSSDAIPVHLITRQAMQIYLDRLEDDGVLCIHISNRYLDLQPFLANSAVALGIKGIHMSDDDAEAPGKNRSHWVALSRSQEVLDRLVHQPRWHSDSNQLSFLGMANYPVPTLGPNPVAGLCFAFQSLCQEQSIAEAKQMGHGGNPADGGSQWEPMETSEYLEGLKDRLTPEIAALNTRLSQTRSEVDALEKPMEAVEAPLKKLRAEVEKVVKELGEVAEQLVENKDDLKLLQRKKNLEAEKANLERKMDPDRRKKEDLEVKKAWLNQLVEQMDKRRRKLERAIEKAPEQLTKNRKVGIPTDDYVNVLAVFSWGG